MQTYREGNNHAKEVRRSPQEDTKPGQKMKGRTPKKKRGEWKIRVTRPRRSDSLPAHQYIWNQYRDEEAARGAFRSLSLKYSFYFLEVLNEDDQVIVDNKEEHDARRARDKLLRESHGL